MSDLLKSKVAKAKGLPPALAGRLVGDTEDELIADAQALLAGLKDYDPTAGDDIGGSVSFLSEALRRRRGGPAGAA